MRPDTPLTEVASHLPREAARHLAAYDAEVQMAVLIQIRSAVVFWEHQDYVFDPIAYEGLLNGLVPSLAPLFAELARLRLENAVLRQLMKSDPLGNLTDVTVEAPWAEPWAGEGGT